MKSDMIFLWHVTHAAYNAKDGISLIPSVFTNEEEALSRFAEMKKNAKATLFNWKNTVDTKDTFTMESPTHTCITMIKLTKDII